MILQGLPGAFGNDLTLFHEQQAVALRGQYRIAGYGYQSPGGIATGDEIGNKIAVFGLQTFEKVFGQKQFGLRNYGTQLN